MRVTIKDVAKRTSLSPSTVSRALNNSGYVSNDTRRRVEKAVTELGYQPNWMARGLKGKPSHLIGLIIPDIFNVYYTAIARSVTDTLRAHNYELILCVSNEDCEIDLNYLKVLRDKCVDGIIYTPPACGSNSVFVRELIHSGIPIVELNRQREKDLLDAVLADNFQGAYQMMEYCLELGHRRIGLILGDANLTTGKKRLEGYQRALENAGVPVDPRLIQIGAFTRQHGEVGTRELLALDNPPTVIFAGNNRILMGSLCVMQQRGLRIPDDISVVAFDDPEWVSVWNPPITVVDVAINEMARLAVDLLQRRIAFPDKEHKPVTYLLSTTLVKRASCKRLM
jgi:LacI family transcriptional regulator